MVFGISSDQDYVVYPLRRQELCARLKEMHPEVKNVRILLFGAFEPNRGPFVQESSAYYLTGLVEPGMMAILNGDGSMTVYRPHYPAERSVWRSPSLLDDAGYCAQQRTVVKELGEQLPGHMFTPFANREMFKQVCTDLSAILSEGAPIFVLCPSGQLADVAQRVLFEKFLQWVPGFEKAYVDVAQVVATMRRGKDAGEIELLTRAVDISVMAHEAALQALAAGIYECEVQANIEFVFTASGAIPAFNTIVASGKNATILHYTDNSDLLKKGDLVVIDCGAQHEHYCADISRTYPVSKKFNERQKKVYQLVLDAQEFIARNAVPGVWLFNKQEPEKSLTHMAQEFFAKHGYAEFFKHNIGHFVGLDVHDVIGESKPLQEGDTITIEPGLYLPEENMAVRIEDMYWITKKGAVCLSDYLPKEISDIEQLMEQIDAQDLEADECEDLNSCCNECDCEDDECDDCCHD